MNTVTDGRLDIVIFPNGGKEYLAKLPSSPEVPEDMYLQQVADFVAQNQNIKEPTRFTGTYRVIDDVLQITWGNWAGIIPHYGEQDTPIEDMPEEAKAVIAKNGWDFSKSEQSESN